MAYYWLVKNGYSSIHGTLERIKDAGGVEITKEKNDEILAAEALRPEDEEGYVLRLRADNLLWERSKLPDPEAQETTTDIILDTLADQEERICNLELFGTDTETEE